MRATTYVSSTQLAAAYQRGRHCQGGDKPGATVADPEPNPGTLGLPFVVMERRTPVATISGGSIAVAAGSSGSHVLTLTGTDFVTSSTVEWTVCASLATTYASPLQIGRRSPR